MIKIESRYMVVGINHTDKKTILSKVIDTHSPSDHDVSYVNVEYETLLKVLEDGIHEPGIGNDLIVRDFVEGDNVGKLVTISREYPNIVD